MPNAFGTSTRTLESLLHDFEPSFDFVGAPQLPESEYVDRLRRIRRDAAVAGHDVILVNANMVGWFHTSNPYLRYVCDWAREGILIIPTDADAGLQLLSFYTESVLLPPGGEPQLVDDIWQVAPWGRESLDRPGSPLVKAVEGCANLLRKLGFERAQIGLIGDETSPPYWAGQAGELPKAKFAPATDIVLRMQRIRSTGELAIIRSAAQLATSPTKLPATSPASASPTTRSTPPSPTPRWHAVEKQVTDTRSASTNTEPTAANRTDTSSATGDLINLYVSNVSYHGYCAQTARTIAVGTITPQQEEVLQMCVDAVRRAEQLIKPGASFDSLHEVAFSAYTERGYLTSTKTRTMPFNWEALPDGSPRPVPRQHVPDQDWEAQGRRLMHVYPATVGPHNPNLGHAIGMPKLPQYNVSSHNTDRMEAGMVFVLHAQWLDPLVAGCNVGDLYLVTDDGAENLSCHTPLEPFRVSV